MSIDVETVRTIDTPTRLVHGPGALARLGELVAGLGVSRPLLVTDPGVVDAGLAAAALAQLPAAVVFAEVRANPDIELVDRAAELYAAEGCDGLVAVGGGSPMDVAKADRGGRRARRLDRRGTSGDTIPSSGASRRWSPCRPPPAPAAR